MVSAHGAPWCLPMVPHGVCPWCPMVSAHGAPWCLPMVPHGVGPWCPMVSAHGAPWCRPMVPHGVCPWMPHGVGPWCPMVSAHGCPMVSAHGALWCLPMVPYASVHQDKSSYQRFFSRLVLYFLPSCVNVFGFGGYTSIIRVYGFLSMRISSDRPAVA